MASPHNQKLFEEAQEWIETVVGEPFRGENFADSLKDGVLLCKYVFQWIFCGLTQFLYFFTLLYRLANKIRPFSVKYNNPATMPFKKMVRHPGHQISSLSPFVTAISCNCRRISRTF